MIATRIALRTLRLLSGAVAGTAVFCALIGAMRSAIDLTGTWSTTDGSVVEVTHKGNHVEARSLVPNPVSVERFGWQSGDLVFEGDIVGSDITGKAILRYPLAAKKACPDQWMQSVDLELQILGPGQLLGRAKNRVLGADCRVTEGPWNGLEYTRRSFDIRETGKQIEIRVADGILFGLDSSVLKPSAVVVLREMKALVFDTQRFSRLTIEGHTDDQGTDAHNQDLSLRRAQSVEAWLVQNGVASNKLEAKGFGKTQPLVPNTTAANRVRNRRVQIQLIK